MTVTASKLCLLVAVVLLAVVFVLGAFTDELDPRELIGMLSLGGAFGFASFLIP